VPRVFFATYTIELVARLPLLAALDGEVEQSPLALGQRALFCLNESSINKRAIYETLKLCENDWCITEETHTFRSIELSRSAF
jgi:hypothetical protein